MNIVEQIKAKQIAEAEERGDGNPYADPTKMRELTETPAERQTVVGKIKAKQLEASPDLYEQKEVVVATNNSPLDSNLFEQLKAAMVTDVARIKTVKVLEEKQAIKADLLPAYLPFVTDFVEQGHDYPNSVAVQVMVWLLDTNQIEAGLDLGLHLVKLGTQSLPPQFNRDIETFIADAMYDWANVQLKAEHSASPYLKQLADAMIDGGWAVHPAVTSKTFAMLAKHDFAQENWQKAVNWCEKAEHANPEGAGVKTLKDKAQKQLDKLPAKTGVQHYIDKKEQTE